MRPLRCLVCYLALVFLGGALLAPWLYWLAQWSASFHPALQKIAANPFHRFVDRSLLILALSALLPLLRNLGINSRHDLGLGKPARHWRQLLGGFLLGFTGLALVVSLALVFGERVWNPHPAAAIAAKMFSAALTAAVVAMLEEILFRGGIFGGLRRGFHWRFALVASSAVYALVHFLERAELSGGVTWLSGLELLPRMLHGFVDFQRLVPGFFSLAIAGWLLGLAYQRTGSLYASIGLHAGWIFWLKSYGFLTAGATGASAWFWGTGKLIDGGLAFAVLLLTLVAAEKFLWRKTVFKKA